MKSSMVIIIEGQVLSSLIVGSAMTLASKAGNPTRLCLNLSSEGDFSGLSFIQFFGFPFARKDKIPKLSKANLVNTKVHLLIQHINQLLRQSMQRAESGR
jgi:hypothetical protein